MSQYVYINDKLLPYQEASISYTDLSIQRGYGIFDFFRVEKGSPVLLEHHLNRFYTSAENMFLEIGKSNEALQTIIHEFIVKNAIKDSGIRITLTGGASPDGFSLGKPALIMAEQPFKPVTKEQFEKGIALMTYNYQRQLPHVKTIDYLMAIHLQATLKNCGADDVLYHNNGMVRECPRANIFMITKDGKLVTPAHQVLKGITRKHVLQVAYTCMEVEERELSLNEMYEAKEIFITSSTKKIMPVHKIDDYCLGINAITKNLSEKLSALTRLAVAE
jgi:D-alanine transaminase/branched-chain amino acid aminotransferase